MSLRGQALWITALMAVAAAAALDIVLVYEFGSLPALLLPLGALAAVVINRHPIVGVCGAILAVPLEPFGLQLSGAGGVSAAELAFIAAGAVGGGRLLWQGAGRLPVDRAHIAFATLLVVMGAGYTVATDTLIVTKILLMWTSFLLVSILVATSGRRDLERLLISIAFAGGVTGLIAIAGSGHQELLAGGEVVVGRAQGSFQQPNVLGFFLALTIPPAIVMSLRSRGLLRWALTAAAVGALAGLMLTLSRTSIIGTGLALTVLLAWKPFRRAALVGIAALMIFASLNSDALLQSRQLQVVGTRLGTLGASGAARDDVRFQIWERAPAIVADHPLLGVGPGNFSLVSRQYGIADQDGLPYDHPHNVPLTIAVETGLPGLVALLAFLASAAVAARQALRRREAATWPLALALGAALSAAAVTSLGDYPLRTNVVMATIMVEVGALIACLRLARADTLEPPGPTPDQSSAPG